MRKPFFAPRPVVFILALLSGGSAAWAQAEPAMSVMPINPASYLAGSLVRSAHQVLEKDPLMPSQIEAAAIILRDAATLDPDNADIWRDIRAAAEMSDLDDLLIEANQRITQLDPWDEGARLARLNDTLERYQTAEERMAAYRALLSPDSREAIGAPVASRLATDLALLLRRQGDSDGFSQWLAEAITLDPSNRNAVALSAGYFRLNVQDPYAEAELLMTLLLADPTSDLTSVALAQLMLEHGAYEGAVRMYKLAIAIRQANLGQSAGDLLADLAIAQWGTGDVNAAIQTINVRQLELDELFRAQIKARYPTAVQEQLLKISAPIDPTLATVRSAILNAMQHPKRVESVQVAVTSYMTLLQSENSRPVEQRNGPQMLRWMLEAVWLAVWLGDDVAKAKTMLADVDKLMPLTDEARTRFEGWFALNEGRFDEAIIRLEPIAGHDVQAKIGLGLGLYLSGRKSEGAMHLLEIARSQPGTTLGVWTSNVLAYFLGQRDKPSETGRRLNELAGSLPPMYEHIISHPKDALRLTLTPAKDLFQAFEPVIVNVELQNLSQLPLAIDWAGPIRPQIILTPTVRITRLPNVSELRPAVVDLSRRLRLEPRQKIVIPVDLRRSYFADAMNVAPVAGAVVECEAAVNFIFTSAGAVQTTMLGSQARSQPFRVDGTRATREWIDATTAAFKQSAEPPDARTLAMLGFMVGAGLDRRAAPEDVRRLTEAAAGCTQAFTRLDSLSQAWVLSVIPIGPGIEPLVALARQSPDRWVRMVYLLHHLRGINDPMLDAARRGDDPGLSRVATLFQEVLEQQARNVQTHQPAPAGRP